MKENLRRCAMIEGQQIRERAGSHRRFACHSGPLIAEAQDHGSLSKEPDPWG